MTNFISSLYDNTLQVRQEVNFGTTRPIIISNVVRQHINIAPKEATASHSLTSCSNSEVLLRKSEGAKRRSEKPEFRKKMSEASKSRWENPEFKKKDFRCQETPV